MEDNGVLKCCTHDIVILTGISEEVIIMETKLKLAEAAKIAGISTNTLNRAKQSGKVSVEKVDNISYYDVSELARVYSKTFNVNQITTRNNELQSNTKVLPPQKNIDLLVLEEKLNSREQEIKSLEKQLEREREISDDMKEALKKAQSHETRLLEYQKEGQGNNIQEVLKPIHKQIKNLEKAANAKAEAEALEKTALEKQLAEQGRALKDAKDAELKREEEKDAELKKAEEEAEVERVRIEQEREASQTWVSKMFGKKKTA